MSQTKKNDSEKKTGGKKPAAQKNNGAKNAGAKNPAAKPNGQKKPADKKTADKALNSVRGGVRPDETRAQEAARRAAGRDGRSHPVTNEAAAKKTATTEKTKQPAAKQPAAKPTADKPAGSKKPSSGSGGRKKGSFSWTRLLAIALICAVGLYLMVQTVSCLTRSVDTEEAVIVTLADTVEATGVAIRNEQLITTDRQGVIVSTVENGGKVSKGETLANIFSSSDEAHAYLRAAELEEQIERFESMATAGEDNAAEVSVLQKQIRGELLRLSGYVYDGAAGDAVAASDELLYLLNKTQIATKLADDFISKENALRDELKGLRDTYPGKPETLRSPLSGYYISNADGYEALLNTSVCDSLTPEKLDELLGLRASVGAQVVGKIADDYVWYMACEVSSSEAARFRLDENGKPVPADYKLYLAYSGVDSITARLTDINVGANTGRSVLIFECRSMVSELSSVRIQPVTIELSSHTGLEVSARSLVTTERVVTDTDAAPVSGSDTPAMKTEYDYGVYIVWGNEIKYRKVKVLYKTEDKVICEYNSGKGYLKMYDKVVTSPGEVYDGKIINTA